MKKKNNPINIIWIAASVPYNRVKHAGGQTFNYYFKNICNDQRFNVRLIALNDDIKATCYENELIGMNKTIINYRNVSLLKKIKNIDSKLNPWTKYAALISNYCVSEIMGVLKSIKNEFEPDIVILEWTGIVVLAGEIKKIFPKCKIVASEHDITYIGTKRRADFYKGVKSFCWRIRAKRTKKIEIGALNNCDLILSHNPDHISLLVQEGVTERKIHWLVPAFHNMNLIRRKPSNKDVLFFGAMDRKENYLSAIWFIENVMPQIIDTGIRFVVLGNNPPDCLKRYESDRVHITGFVDNIEPYFANSICFVAPLVLGAGIKVKVIEALSSGIPVLTNDIGVEGIHAIDGKEYLHCSNAEEYAIAIRKLIRNEINISELEQCEKNLVKNEYSLEKSLYNYKRELLSLSKDESADKDDTLSFKNPK